MNWLKFTLWTYLIFALHSTVAPSLAFAGYVPNLVLAGLVIMTCRISGKAGLMAAALWGLLADCLADGPLGAGIACFSLSTWMLQRCTTRWRNNLSWRIAVVSAPLIWLDSVGMAYLRGQFGGHPADLPALCAFAAGSAIYTGLVIAVAESAKRIVRGTADEHVAVAGPTVSNKWRMLTE